MSRQILRLRAWKVPSIIEPVRNECLNQYLTNYQPSQCFEKLWVLAMEFLDWISDKLNEKHLHKKGVLLRTARIRDANPLVLPYGPAE